MNPDPKKETEVKMSLFSRDFMNDPVVSRNTYKGTGNQCNVWLLRPLFLGSHRNFTWKRISDRGEVMEYRKN